MDWEENLAELCFHHHQSYAQDHMNIYANFFFFSSVNFIRVMVILFCRWRDVKLRAFDNAKHRTYVDLKVRTILHSPCIYKLAFNVLSGLN